MRPYRPPAPPDRLWELYGLQMWSWFGLRRRCHLLQQQVDDLQRRLDHLEFWASEGKRRNL